MEFSRNKTADAIIVGGGVIGLAIARELAMRGERQVTLLERSQPGAEASWAAAGILAPQVEANQTDEFFRLACASRDTYRQFAAALQEETGVDVELDTTGTLYVGFTDEDEKECRDRFQWQTQEGLSVEWLSGDDARKLEPKVSERVSCALRFPNDYQVENRRLIEALVRANEKLGVRLISNCNVSSLAIHRETICGVETSKGSISAPVVVIAAGAWSSFIKCVLPPINIDPVRGQMLCFNSPARLARHVIYSSRGYLVPRKEGRLLAGSTSEHVAFDKRVTDEGINVIRSSAGEIMPTLRDIPLADSWAGFRPHANDGLPVLGPSEEVRGLFFATGHYRNGILLAPITGKFVADSIITGDTSRRLQAFLPSRFVKEVAVV